MTEMAPQSAPQTLAALLADPVVEEIMINGPDKTFVISGGQKQRYPLTWSSDDALREHIVALVAQAGRTLDDNTPLIDVRLADGSRLNAVIPPLAPVTTATIRRFVLRERNLDDLMQLGVLSGPAKMFLEAAVPAGINLLICGGTSSGKTTLLNSLCTCIDAHERVVTIEETRELSIPLDDVCALETQFGANRRWTIRDLVKNALRMRPDRIIVGEVRGGEALDMLTAMSTGHDGSMCTIHADNPREALSKLHTYTLMTGEGIPSRVALEMISRAVQIIVFCKRVRDGDLRVVDTIFEVTGLQGDTLTGQELFARRAGGELSWTGARPECEARITEAGYNIAHIFRDGAAMWDRRSGW